MLVLLIRPFHAAKNYKAIRLQGWKMLLIESDTLQNELFVTWGLSIDRHGHYSCLHIQHNGNRFAARSNSVKTFVFI